MRSSLNRDFSDLRCENPTDHKLVHDIQDQPAQAGKILAEYGLSPIESEVEAVNDSLQVVGCYKTLHDHRKYHWKVVDPDQIILPSVGDSHHQYLDMESQLVENLGLDKYWRKINILIFYIEKFSCRPKPGHSFYQRKKRDLTVLLEVHSQDSDIQTQVYNQDNKRVSDHLKPGKYYDANHHKVENELEVVLEHLELADSLVAQLRKPPQSTERERYTHQASEAGQK